MKVGEPSAAPKTLTSYLGTEEFAYVAVTATASTPISRVPVSITTLVPD